MVSILDEHRQSTYHLNLMGTNCLISCPFTLLQQMLGALLKCPPEFRGKTWGLFGLETVNKLCSLLSLKFKHCSNKRCQRHLTSLLFEVVQFEFGNQHQVNTSRSLWILFLLSNSPYSKFNLPFPPS